jgi:excisionase family DNA binding protein
LQNRIVFCYIGTLQETRSDSGEITVKEQVMSPIAITIGNACKISGLSRSTLYKAMKASEFATIKRGHRRLINFESFRRWLESHQSERWEDADKTSKTTATRAARKQKREAVKDREQSKPSPVAQTSKSRRGRPRNPDPRQLDIEYDCLYLLSGGAHQ